jgi:hypothetical protein
MVAHGFGGGGALRVEDGGFRHDGHESFHRGKGSVSEGGGQEDFFNLRDPVKKMPAAREETARHAIEKTSPFRA